MALLNVVFGLLEQIESKYIKVHQNRCVLVRNRNAICLRCAQACTSGCITYADNKLTISPDKCIGCGTCATVCPTCALEAREPDDAELLKELISATNATDGQCTIACVDTLKEAEDVYDPTKVVGVACLGRIEESILLSLIKVGAKRIDLVKGDCTACDYGVGLETAQSVCESASTLLRTWNNGTEVCICDELPGSVLLAGKKEYDESRRAFFSAMKDEIKSPTGQAVAYATQEKPGDNEVAEPKYVKVMSDGTLPHFIPNRRERLLDCLSYFGEPQDVLIETRLWGHVIIDTDICNSCHMCATFCPTGAITKYFEKDGSLGVDYSPGACVKCRCCVDICRASALTISEEVFAVDLLSGAVERYKMRPVKNPPGKSNSILNAVKSLLNEDQIYER